jgi:hypothetical protein
MTSLLKHRPWAAAAALVGFAMTALYVALIVTQGNTVGEWLPWAVAMAIGSGLAFASTQTADLRVTRKLLIATMAIFAIIGLVAILSIGFGFLLAAAAALIAFVRLA